MWGASKGKDAWGKDKGGKGKAKGKGVEGGKGSKAQGHTLKRTRVSADKFCGTVSVWKGKYGFIQPAEEIAHEKASLHNGALFVSMDNVQGAQELEAGAPVEFHIFEDESGLGAEEVVQTGPSTGKGPGKGCAKGGAKGGKDASWKGGKDAWSGGGGWDSGKAGAASWGWGGKDAGYGGKNAGWGGKDAGYGGKNAGWGGKDGYGGKSAGLGGKDAGYGGKGASKGWGPSSVKGGWSDPYGGKGAGAGWKGMEKGKGKSKSKEGGKGHMLPRTRITAEKFLGTVNAWKGKYGWITPAEEVAHEKAKCHKGGIFVGIDDLVGRTDLTEGATVEFHIWEDSSGLGAEEVAQS